MVLVCSVIDSQKLTNIDKILTKYFGGSQPSEM